MGEAGRRQAAAMTAVDLQQDAEVGGEDVGEASRRQTAAMTAVNIQQVVQRLSQHEHAGQHNIEQVKNLALARSP